MKHNLAFVERVQALLIVRGVDTWVFGGWGEEVRGLIEPREHVDLDLLYPAESWDCVDILSLDWVAAKRFPWKRAFMFDGIMVELFLVRRDEHGWYTRLARRMHRWPDNVFATNGRMRLASTAALASYRHSYRVDAA